MASNKDLEKEILELDAKAVVKDLNNAELSTLLKELKDKAAAGAESNTDEAEAEEEAERKPGYYICKGKSMTHKIGMLDAGDGPFKADFFSSKEDLTRLKKAKVIELQK